MDEKLWTNQDMELTEMLLRVLKEIRAYCENNSCDTCMVRETCKNGQPGILFSKFRITIERLD